MKQSKYRESEREKTLFDIMAELWCARMILLVSVGIALICAFVFIALSHPY